MIDEYIDSYHEPQLQESEKPTGAWQWQISEQVIDVEDNMDINIFNKECDDLAVDNNFNFSTETTE